MEKTLTPQEYAVLRQATDPAFRNKHDELFQPGTYSQAARGQELFSSDTKFNSGCGWPAFYAAKAGDKVKLLHDNSYGMDPVPVPAPAAEPPTSATSSTTPPINPTGQRLLHQLHQHQIHPRTNHPTRRRANYTVAK